MSARNPMKRGLRSARKAQRESTRGLGIPAGGRMLAVIYASGASIDYRSPLAPHQLVDAMRLLADAVEAKLPRETPTVAETAAETPASVETAAETPASVETAAETPTAAEET